MMVKVLSIYRRYDYVFSFDISGLLFPFMPLLLLQKMMFRKKPHIFALDIGTCRINWIRQKIILWMMKGTVDVVFCLTSVQIGWWVKDMRFDRVKFIHCSVDDAEPLSPLPSGGYIFSGGLGGRDYTTLMAATRNLSEKVVVVVGRDGLTGKTGLEGIRQDAQNLEVCYNLPYEQYLDKMRRAKIVVLPLEDVPYAVGQSVMLDAMKVGKPLIISRIPATLDYVADGKTAIFVSPGNAGELEAKIRLLLSDDELREKLGRNARRVIENSLNTRTMAQEIQAIMDQISSS
jgi:glycosyltransferase involved in cell wall biosynthesis